MKCPHCKMEIPSNAEICPYCHSRLLNSWGFANIGPFKEREYRGNSNNGCMVILPLILIAASSICFLISTYI